MSTGWKRLLISINLLVAIPWIITALTEDTRIGNNLFLGLIGFTVAYWCLIFLVVWVVNGFKDGQKKSSGSTPN